MSLSKESLEEVKEILSHFPNKRAALLPVLRVVEGEVGYIEEDECKVVGELLGLSPAYVYGSLTFYTHFRRKSHGKYRIMVCATLMCSLQSCSSIIEHLEARLGISVGERTADSRFSLEKVECLASCGTAPVMQINDDYYEGLTVERVDKILSSLD